MATAAWKNYCCGGSSWWWRQFKHASNIQFWDKMRNTVKTKFRIGVNYTDFWFQFYGKMLHSTFDCNTFILFQKNIYNPCCRWVTAFFVFKPRSCKRWSHLAPQTICSRIAFQMCLTSAVGEKIIGFFFFSTGVSNKQLYSSELGWKLCLLRSRVDFVSVMYCAMQNDRSFF